MIIGEVKRYLRDNNSIRVSRSVRDLAYKAMQFKERYIREKGREPTIDIIAKELEVEREDIAYSFDAVQDPVSLQEPVYNDGAESIYIMDQVKDSKNTDEAWIENMTIKQIMKKLNDKEKMMHRSRKERNRQKWQENYIYAQRLSAIWMTLRIVCLRH